MEELVPVMEEYGQNRPTKAKPSGLLNLLVTSVQVRVILECLFVVDTQTFHLCVDINTH